MAEAASPRRRAQPRSAAIPRAVQACGEHPSGRSRNRPAHGSRVPRSREWPGSCDPGPGDAGNPREAPAGVPNRPGSRPVRARRSSLLRPVAGHAERPIAACADEVEDLVNDGMRRELLGYVLDALLQRALVREEQSIGAADVVDLIAREAAAAQADDVEASEMGAVPERHPIGNDIILDSGHAADEGVRADAHELVDSDATAQDHVIADLAVAGEHDVVGHDHVAADDAVVGDMRVREEHAAVADQRLSGAVRGARIECNALSDGAVRSDDEHGRLTGVFEILRGVPDRSEREDLRPRPDPGVPGDYGMADELR